MILTIPAELVEPLRLAVREGFHDQLEEADAQSDPGDRQADQGLLDVIGWHDPEGEQPAVEVDAGAHREALLRGLLACVEEARGVRDDEHAGVGERAEAKVYAAQAVGLIQRVEEVEAGPAAQR
jgi:hypothetical protein